VSPERAPSPQLASQLESIERNDLQFLSARDEPEDKTGARRLSPVEVDILIQTQGVKVEKQVKERMGY
jgi:hypothetical protein